MDQLPAAGVLTGPVDVRAVPDDRGGALWRLAAAGRQLDANVVRVRPGTRIDTHVEPDLDVLLCVIGGGGELESAAGRQLLEPGCVAWLPHGTPRAVTAGDEGLVYVTAHRRRPGLAVRGTRRAAPVEAVDEGGEGACLLHRVCPGCDRPSDDATAAYCSRCGTALPSQ
ncbi:cupin domain-containing protein [Streptomyces sp. NPDC003860]